MPLSRQLKLGAIMSYFAIGINIITGLLYTPWMIHSIGRENFGLYTLTISVISFFVFDFGLSAAVTRFIAKYLAEGRQDKADNCMGLVCKLYILIDVVMLLILSGVYFFIPQLYKELSFEEIESFKVVYIVAAIYSVVSFPFIPVNGIFMAHEKFIQVKLCDILHKIIIVLAMSICLLLGGGLYSLVLVHAVAGLITIALKLYFIKKYTHQGISWYYFNRSEFKEIVGFSGWVTAMSIAQRFIFNIAPSILGALSGSASIAILGIATTLEGYTFTFANAINGMFLPKISRIVANDNGDILPLMVRIGRIQIYITSLIIFGVICLGEHFIQLWVGKDFSESYLCALFIIVPSLFQLPQEIGNQTIFVKNKVKKLAIVYILMAFINIVLAIFLAPNFGALGISMSVFVAYLVRTIGMDVIFYRDLHIDVLSFFKDTYLKLFIPLVICFIFGFTINIVVRIDSWFGFVIKGLFYVCSYLAVMYLFAMNNSERELILTPLRRIRKKI